MIKGSVLHLKDTLGQVYKRGGGGAMLSPQVICKKVTILPVGSLVRNFL